MEPEFVEVTLFDTHGVEFGKARVRMTGVAQPVLLVFNDSTESIREESRYFYRSATDADRYYEVGDFAVVGNFRYAKHPGHP